MSQHLWHPYSQLSGNPKFPTVTKGEGAYLYINNTPVIDAIASWWCVIHGYNHPELLSAINQQASILPHVMLGGLTHPWAEQLATTLAEITPGNLQHVFFSDSGSVGVEVALKMALQYWQNKGQKKTRFLALRGGYHGDTFLAMSVSEPAGMHQFFSNLPQQVFLDRPPAWDASEKEIVQALQKAEAQIAADSTTLAACIVEPLVQGAEGFYMYATGYLSGLRHLCHRYNVLFIADEVATGFFRTGTWFACDAAQITPDIMVIGKGLTGGYMGHAATLATPEIFKAFFGPQKTFMHGPTFMGNPLACQLALTSIEILKRPETQQHIQNIASAITTRFQALHSPHIREIRTWGTIGAITVSKNTDTLSAFCLAHGVWIRPLGNVIYIAPPYCIATADIAKIGDVIQAWLSEGCPTHTLQNQR